MKRLAVLLCSALFAGACDDAMRPNEQETWGVEPTERGVVAVADDWIVTAGSGDLDSGVVTGVNVYYRGEPVGGGGIYDFEADGRVWNEWVPFLVPTYPGYSALRSFVTSGDTLLLAFADSVTPPSESPSTQPLLEFDVRIIRNRTTLEFALGGMHMVFFPIRIGEAYTIACRSGNAAQDTTFVINHAAPDRSIIFVGPSRYELRGAHFDIDFATDAPRMKVGIGRDAVADGGLVKFDLDASLRAVPPRYYVNSRLAVIPKY
jgi:hypothetical protein